VALAQRHTRCFATHSASGNHRVHSERYPTVANGWVDSLVGRSGTAGRGTSDRVCHPVSQRDHRPNGDPRRGGLPTSVVRRAPLGVCRVLRSAGTDLRGFSGWAALWNRPNRQSLLIVRRLMNREYIAWDSPTLGRRMELLYFGHAGHPMIWFPT